MAMRHLTAPDPAAAAEACAAHIAARLEEALQERGQAALALSGGAGPRGLFERLAVTRLPWRGIHFFWADERAVPPADERSNYRLAAESLLIPAHVPQGNIHRIHGELMPEAAARAYADEIRAHFGLGEGELPRFDVIHLGLGENAHTASLFPGDPLVEDRQGIAAAAHVSAEPPWRITLLPGVLIAARHAAFLATGAQKAEAVRAVFQEPFQPMRWPAQLMRQAPDVVWFLDAAAAARLGAE